MSSKRAQLIISCSTSSIDTMLHGMQHGALALQKDLDKYVSQGRWYLDPGSTVQTSALQTKQQPDDHLMSNIYPIRIGPSTTLHLSDLGEDWLIENVGQIRSNQMIRFDF